MNYYTDVLKKYVVFGGRAARKEYWMFFLFNLVISVVLAIVDGIAGTRFEASGSAGAASGGVFQSLYALAVFLPSLAVTFRRLHDTGRSGWWVLISLVPAVGWIILLVFMVMDGDSGSNKYGPNPRESTATAPPAAAPGAAGFPPPPAAPVAGAAYPPAPSAPMGGETPAPAATTSAPPPPPATVSAPAPPPASAPPASESPAVSAPPAVDESSGTLEQHCSQCGAAIGGSDEFCQACGIEISGGEHTHAADDDAAGDGPATT